MKDIVNGIEHYKKLFGISIPDSEFEVDKITFDEWIRSFPRVKRENYCGGSEYHVKFGSKLFLIGVSTFNDRYFNLKEEIKRW